MNELPPVPITSAAADTEHQFKVAHDEELTECMASDLEGLQSEAAEGLALKPSSFNITYMHNAKKYVVHPFLLR